MFQNVLINAKGETKRRKGNNLKERAPFSINQSIYPESRKFSAKSSLVTRNAIK